METFLTKIIEQGAAYAPQVVGAILTLIIGMWLAGWITRMARRAFSVRKLDVTVQPFLLSIINVGLKILVLLAVAQMFGVQTTSFLAIFSALAFAIGLALKGSLGHFASGVLLLVFKPYKVGDLVDISGKVGTVTEIQVFNTVLRTLDNKKIIIPNGVITGNVITNISGQGTIGVDMTIGISYGSDIDQARSIIQQVARSCEWVLDDPAPLIKVVELADSSVNFLVRPWCASEHYWDV